MWQEEGCITYEMNFWVIILCPVFVN